MAGNKNMRFNLIAVAATLTVVGICYVGASHLIVKSAEKSYQNLTTKIESFDGLNVVEESAEFGFLKARGEFVVSQNLKGFEGSQTSIKVLSHVKWVGVPSIQGFVIDGTINHTSSASLEIEPYVREKLKDGLGVNLWGELKLKATASTNGLQVAITNPTSNPFYLTPTLSSDAYAIVDGQAQINLETNGKELEFTISSKDGSITIIHRDNLLIDNFSLERKDLSEHAKFESYEGKLKIADGRISELSASADKVSVVEKLKNLVSVSNLKLQVKKNTLDNQVAGKVGYSLDLSTDGLVSEGQSLGKAGIKANLGQLSEIPLYYVLDKLPMITKGTKEGLKYDRGGEKHREMLGHAQALLEDSPRLDIENLNLTISINDTNINLGANGYLAFNAEGLPSGFLLRSEDRLKNYNIKKHLEVLLNTNLPSPLLRSFGLPEQVAKGGSQEIKIKDSMLYINGMPLMRL